MKEVDRIPESRARFGANLSKSKVYDELARRKEQSKETQRQVLENFKQALDKKR